MVFANMEVSMELNFRNKSDAILINDLKTMVTQERKVLTEILHYLREVERRRLFLERGYASLFAFVTEELGYSEAAAYRRIQAMKLIQDLPEVEEKIESGKLSLTVASQLRHFIHKKANVSIEEKRDLIQQLEGTSARACEKKLIQMSPEEALPKEKTRAISEEKTVIQFVANQKLMRKIEKLKSLLSHQNIEGRYDQLFEKAVDMALERLDPEKREERREKKKLTSAPKLEMKGRYISKGVRDQVWLNAKGRCQYRDKLTGKACGSQYMLEMDHLKPYALGGSHTLDNLQLLCRNHNQHKAKKIFGEVKVMTVE